MLLWFVSSVVLVNWNGLRVHNLKWQFEVVVFCWICFLWNFDTVNISIRNLFTVDYYDDFITRYLCHVLVIFFDLHCSIDCCQDLFLIIMCWLFPVCDDLVIAVAGGALHTNYKISKGDNTPIVMVIPGLSSDSTSPVSLILLLHLLCLYYRIFC